jgi:Protein of unknown function (DUF3703)
LLELEQYIIANGNKKCNSAFKHLMRIHNVSQPYTIKHTIIHIRILKFAFIALEPLEIIIQILHSLFSFKFLLQNIFPQGNTGGASGILKGKMTIPMDLKKLCEN